MALLSDLKSSFYIVAVLDDYAAHFGENKQIFYTIRKRFGRIEFLVSIQGEMYDPFENGEDSQRRRIEKILALNMNSQESCINYLYVMGRNIITGHVPLEKTRRSLLKDPFVVAIILGVLAGVICLRIPEAANRFIINDVMSPTYEVLLDLLAGIMGPVIFISLTTSIISLDNVNDLTNMGFKIFRRFLKIIFFVTAVSIVIGMLVFGEFSSEGIDFSPDQIITMFLNIIPVNLISPFLENNTPQLVVLAFIAGFALLLLKERTKDINRILHQCNDWIMTVLKIVNQVLPAVPFLSIAVTIGQGNAEVLVQGWKFIAASYIIFTVCLLVKMFKTKAVTKMSAMDILRKSKAAILTGFATQSTTAPISQMYEISQKELHIKQEFSSFWIPMCSAMLALKTTVNVILATLMMTELMGVPISLSFLFVLIILTLEMSLASPGTIGSWVIAFEAFSMPTSDIGLFSTFRVFTANYSTGIVMAYFMLEQMEAAYKMDGLETENEPAAAAAGMQG